MKRLIWLTSPMWIAAIMVGLAHLLWPFLGPDGRAGVIWLFTQLAGICAVISLVIIGLWMLPGILYGMVGGSPAGGFWMGMLRGWWRRR